MTTDKNIVACKTAESASREIQREIASLCETVNLCTVAEFAEQILATAAMQGRLYIVGNGGSAALASHLCADLNEAFAQAPTKQDLYVVSLADAVATTSAIANDHGVRDVFSWHLRRVLKPTDALIAITATGVSENIVRAVDAARSRGAVCLLMTAAGYDERMADSASCLAVASRSVFVVETVHSCFSHLVAAYLRSRLAVPLPLLPIVACEEDNQ